MGLLNAEETARFEDVYHRMEAKLWGYALRVLRDEQLAAGVVQQSALDLFESFRGLSHLSDDKLCGYLYVITRNNVMDAVKRQKRETPFTVLGEEEAERQADGGVEELVLKRLELEALRRAVSRLPERYAQYIRMTYLDELDRRTVARLLKVKPDSLRMMDLRARRLLKTLIEQEAGQEEGRREGKQRGGAR